MYKIDNDIGFDPLKDILMNENIIASLQRRIKKLEGENKQLREQLKVAYAKVYKKI